MLRVPRVLTRDQIKDRMMKSVKFLQQNNIKPVQIANDMDVSYSTVMSWMSGRRIPRMPTVRSIEQLYGIKIL